jgi:hypothetical protein
MTASALIVNFGPAILFLVLWFLVIRKFRQPSLKTNLRLIELAEENQKVLREILEALKGHKDDK